MKQRTTTMCAAMLCLAAVSAAAQTNSLTPPAVTSTTGDPVSVRVKPGYQAQCLKSTATRQGPAKAPTTQSASYLLWAEERRGQEFLGTSFLFQNEPVNLLYELNSRGEPKDIPPLIETKIPGFERQYGAEIKQLTSGLIASLTGRYGGKPLEIGKDYGPTFDFCLASGNHAASWPEGSTIVRGTLEFEGRPAFLLTQTFKQVCGQGIGRFTVEGTSWGLVDQGSGLTVKSASRYGMNAYSTEIASAEEFMNCQLTPR